METAQTETECSYKLAATAKCAHQACSCMVALGERFCSDGCAAQANSGETGSCGCGHPGCTEASGARHHVVGSGLLN